LFDGETIPAFSLHPDPYNPTSARIARIAFIPDGAFSLVIWFAKAFPYAA